MLWNAFTFATAIAWACVFSENVRAANACAPDEKVRGAIEAYAKARRADGKISEIEAIRELARDPSALERLANPKLENRLVTPGGTELRGPRYALENPAQMQADFKRRIAKEGMQASMQDLWAPELERILENTKAGADDLAGRELAASLDEAKEVFAEVLSEAQAMKDSGKIPYLDFHRLVFKYAVAQSIRSGPTMRYYDDPVPKKAKVEKFNRKQHLGDALEERVNQVTRQNDVFFAPTHGDINISGLVRAREGDIALLGLVTKDVRADGSKMSPLEHLEHDYDHARGIREQNEAIYETRTVNDVRIRISKENGVRSDGATAEEVNAWREYSAQHRTAWRQAYEMGLEKLPPAKNFAAALFGFQMLREENNPYDPVAMMRALDKRDFQSDDVSRFVNARFYEAHRPVLAKLLGAENAVQRPEMIRKAMEEARRWHEDFWQSLVPKETMRRFAPVEFTAHSEDFGVIAVMRDPIERITITKTFSENAEPVWSALERELAKVEAAERSRRSGQNQKGVFGSFTPEEHRSIQARAENLIQEKTGKSALTDPKISLYSMQLRFLEQNHSAEADLSEARRRLTGAMVQKANAEAAKGLLRKIQARAPQIKPEMFTSRDGGYQLRLDLGDGRSVAIETPRPDDLSSRIERTISGLDAGLHPPQSAVAPKLAEPFLPRASKAENIVAKLRSDPKFQERAAKGKGDEYVYHLDPFDPSVRLPEHWPRHKVRDLKEAGKALGFTPVEHPRMRPEDPPVFKATYSLSGKTHTMDLSVQQDYFIKGQYPTRGRFKKPPEIFKVYPRISAHELPNFFSKLLAAGDVHDAVGFKVGAVTEGILRPDRLVFYFERPDLALKFAQAVNEIAAGTKPSDLPSLTGEVGTHAAVGMDSPTESHRAIVSRILSKSAQEGTDVNAELRRAGIDPETFMPLEIADLVKGRRPLDEGFISLLLHKQNEGAVQAALKRYGPKAEREIRELVKITIDNEVNPRAVARVIEENYGEGCVF